MRLGPKPGRIPTFAEMGDLAMNQTQSSFLQTAVPAAQSAQRSYGVPASVLMAQATRESNWGQSALAKQANNFFGIRANEQADPGRYIEFPMSAFVDGRQSQVMAKFARYASPQLCFMAHAYLLSMELRYRTAMQVKSDATSFAFALQNCGYSADQNYGNALMAIVHQFDLTQYDVAAADGAPQPVKTAGTAAGPTTPGTPTPAALSSVPQTKAMPAAPAKVKP
jgi:flagellum-specific peptidoglycan hydrolase FlgJ